MSGKNLVKRFINVAIWHFTTFTTTFSLQYKEICGFFQRKLGQIRSYIERMNGWMEMQKTFHINMNLKNSSNKKYSLFQKPENSSHWAWLCFFVKHSQLDHPEVALLQLNFCRSVSKQPVSRGAQRRGFRSEVFLGLYCSIYRHSLTSVLALVSTELEITLPASGALNAKLCLVNKAVCLDSFCRLGSLNFNAGSEGNEGVCQGRAKGGSCGSCLQTALQPIIYVQLNWQKCLPHTLLPTVLTFASCTVC